MLIYYHKNEEISRLVINASGRHISSRGDVMEKSFSIEPSKAIMLAEARELSACNSFTEKYGLMLSEKQIANLVEKRFESLKANGRIEFGEGILKKLVYAFCDSPYIDQQNWEETLAELQNAFYYYKSEADDRLSDDELIEFMRKTYNGKAQGSLEYLTETSLEELCRNARHGRFSDSDDDIIH